MSAISSFGWSIILSFIIVYVSSTTHTPYTHDSITCFAVRRYQSEDINVHTQSAQSITDQSCVNGCIVTVDSERVRLAHVGLGSLFI